MSTKDRMNVRVDIDTLSVYPAANDGTERIGIVSEYVVNEGARTPGRDGKVGAKFTSRRVTVKLKDDDRVWVGQFSNENWKKPAKLKTITLRLIEEKVTVE